jgi:hypothetical protein
LRRRCSAAALAAAAALGLAALPAAAGVSSALCDATERLSVEQKDRLLHFAAAVRAELERSGARAALISRSGVDLGWFDIRYSHAGITLKHHADVPWAVRQLYYACDEGRPRLFDQGISGFVLGTDRPSFGFVSLVLLPEEAALALERAALDNPLALGLLGGTYSANAHAFSTRYQNCNQWLAELMAVAWSRPPLPAPATRASAQQELKDQRYEPSAVDAGWRVLRWLSNLSPWLHSDDHPPQDLEHNRFRISLPAALEAFVRRRWPEAQRVELCHDGQRIIVRRGSWEPLPASCQAGSGDQTLALGL